MKLISDFGQRPQTHGRIRTGEQVMGKSGKEPRSLTRFRFTSPDLEALTIIASQYGGEPRAWVEPKAAVTDQYEVYTDADEIEVWLPPDALTVAYESWGGKGCMRRCDGLVCEIPAVDPDGGWDERPCLCASENLRVCKAKTRLSVALPGVPFKGYWRYESGSDAVADEMSAFEPIVQHVQARGILKARLRMEQRQKIARDGKKRKFWITKLELAATLEELASGQAGLPGVPVVQAAALMAGEVRPMTPEREVARIVDEGVLVPSDEPRVARVLDSEIIDAEIVDEPPRSGLSAQHRALHAAIATVCAAHILDPDDLRHRLVRTLTKGRASSTNDLTKEEMGRALEILGEVNAGVRDVELVGDGDSGTVKMKVTS